MTRTARHGLRILTLPIASYLGPSGTEVPSLGSTDAVLGANLIECLRTGAWISNPQPPEAHLSHKDNADLSAREPRESDDRHSVDVEHLEVLGGAETRSRQRDRRSARGASPASSGFRRTQYLASRVVRSRAKVRASTDQCRAHRDGATGSAAGHRRYRAAVPPLPARRWVRRKTRTSSVAISAV